jgi:hypothetical protein
MIKCTLCHDVGWVCEEFPGRSFCGCGAAGMPCSLCNAPEDGEAPRMPDGFKIEDDKGSWLH